MPVQETFWAQRFAWSPTASDSLDGHCEKPRTPWPHRPQERVRILAAPPADDVSSVAMTATDAHRTIDALWRIESRSSRARAPGARRGLAEELARRARHGARAMAALRDPGQSGAWLMATASIAPSIICDASDARTQA